MDTSKEYIEMCRKAEDIQTLWNFKDGDYIYTSHKNNEPSWRVWSGYDAWDYPCVTSLRDPIWLPRQDQLQDMVIEKYKKHWGNSVMLGLMEEVVGWGTQYTYVSMEQLWLCFVMDERYGKLWNGSEWVVK